MAIYKITNLLNNKVYIGQTTASDPMKRIKKHFEKNLHNNFYIQKVIQKYGKDNFILDFLT